MQVDPDLCHDVLRSQYSHVVVLDAKGNVEGVLAEPAGPARGESTAGGALPEASIGESFAARCEAASSSPGDLADQAARGIREVLAARRSSFHVEVPVKEGGETRWVALRVDPLAKPAGGAVLTCANATASRGAVEALRGTRDDLVRRLSGRTAELARANRGLRAELEQRERTERELRLLQSLLLAMAEATDVHAAMTTVLGRICELTGWEHGEAWLPGAGDAHLELSATWHVHRPGLAAFARETAGITFAPGKGLPGRVWRSRCAEWIDDVSKAKNFFRAEHARRAGLKTGVGVPIMSGDEVVAVMAFFMSARRERDHRLVHLLSAGTATLGAAIARKRADDRLRALAEELEHRVAERTAALAERESRLRAVFDTAAEGIVTSDEAGTIESVNPAAARMFGYDADELAGRNVSVLMSAPHRAHHDRYIAEYRRTDESGILGTTRELEGRRRDGREFPLELALSEFRAGGRRHFTAVIRDTSERRRAEERLRRQQEELANAGRLSTIAEMATSIAHELNQPLTAITTYCDTCERLLAGGAADPARIGGMLRRVSEQAIRAGDMIRRLRALVRRREPARARLSLNPLVEEVLALTAKERRELDVEIDVALDAALPNVDIDAIQIEQLLLNLVRNALEAMRGTERRRLRVATARTDDGGVELVVSDTGAGLSAEECERAFEPFYSTRRDGAGMGLPISRTIAEAHHGRLWLASQAGRGTDVHLVLPGAGHGAVA